MRVRRYLELDQNGDRGNQNLMHMLQRFRLHVSDNFETDMFGAKKEKRDMSDEEKEWLDALEAGTLDDNGDVKKDRDSALLTPRQVGSYDNSVVHLSVQYPRSKVFRILRPFCLELSSSAGPLF